MRQKMIPLELNLIWLSSPTSILHHLEIEDSKPRVNVTIHPSKWAKLVANYLYGPPGSLYRNEEPIILKHYLMQMEVRNKPPSERPCPFTSSFQEDLFLEWWRFYQAFTCICRRLRYKFWTLYFSFVTYYYELLIV